MNGFLNPRINSALRKEHFVASFVEGSVRLDVSLLSKQNLQAKACTSDIKKNSIGPICISAAMTEFDGMGIEGVECAVTFF